MASAQEQAPAREVAEVHQSPPERPPATQQNGHKTPPTPPNPEGNLQERNAKRERPTAQRRASEEVGVNGHVKNQNPSSNQPGGEREVEQTSSQPGLERKVDTTNGAAESGKQPANNDAGEGSPPATEEVEVKGSAQSRSEKLAKEAADAQTAVQQAAKLAAIKQTEALQAANEAAEEIAERAAKQQKVAAEQSLGSPTGKTSQREEGKGDGVATGSPQQAATQESVPQVSGSNAANPATPQGNSATQNSITEGSEDIAANPATQQSFPYVAGFDVPNLVQGVPTVLPLQPNGIFAIPPAPGPQVSSIAGGDQSFGTVNVSPIQGVGQPLTAPVDPSPPRTTPQTQIPPEEQGPAPMQVE